MGWPQLSQTPYVSVSNLLEGVLDLAQAVDQLVDQGLVLAAFGGHLARVGEVRVVVEAFGAVPELRQLATQRVALLLEGGPQSLDCRVGCHPSECNRMVI